MFHTHIKNLLLLLFFMLLFCNTVNAQQLDLSLPPIDLDFCVKNVELCERIDEVSNQTVLPQFKFKDTDLRQEKAVFYGLNFLDSLTTWRAVNKGYGKEKNPLMPKYPNLGDIIIHKFMTLTLIDYLQVLDDRSILITFNYGLGATVANNMSVVLNNE